MKEEIELQTKKDLENLLLEIDGKGYGAYKEIKGGYTFDQFTLWIDHVQADPFAAPSKVRVVMPMKYAGIEPSLIENKIKRIAVADFLTRTFSRHVKDSYERKYGSGKSGLILIENCGQQILERTSIIIKPKEVELRFEIGLPAAGRRVMGKSASTMLCKDIPELVKQTLVYKNIDTESMQKQVTLVVDQEFIRAQLIEQNLVAFIADGAILPRKDGVSDEPLLKGSISFESPEEMAVTMHLPSGKIVRGMGIKEGITLIVGGGYHGKSTLLKALERSVYNHIPGDGREYVITRADAVKIRAEDGRSVQKVNITPFINNLPNHKDTKAFTTENASGSTSQATNVIEALEAQSKVLLIDEDTSATNFMIRDSRMQKLVQKEKEPITPFIDQVKALSTEYGVSTILVVGGCGDYFDVADQVIMMDEYMPKDVTKTAQIIATQDQIKRYTTEVPAFEHGSVRILKKGNFVSEDRKERLKAKGLDTIYSKNVTIDLSYIEQLVQEGQTNAIVVMLEYLANYIINGELTLLECIEALYKEIEENGLDCLAKYNKYPGNLVLPRPYELFATINRYRKLKIK